MDPNAQLELTVSQLTNTKLQGSGLQYGDVTQGYLKDLSVLMATLPEIQKKKSRELSADNWANAIALLSKMEGVLEAESHFVKVPNCVNIYKPSANIFEPPT
jgi:hypothetical protein